MRTSALLLLTTAAFAHYTWVAPEAGALTPGRPATLRICHGHEFPEGEEKISVAGAETVMLSPSGVRTPLQLSARPHDVVTHFTPRESGLHRLVYTQDRGVSSRTPRGVRPGGRDKNPGAAQAFRTYRSAVAYLPAGAAPSAAASPAGIEAELIGIPRPGGVWELQLLRRGQPVAGAAIQILGARPGATLDAGTTDAQGKVAAHPPAGAGPLLFSVEWKDQAPAGSSYDTVNYSTSLYVTR